MTSVPKRGLRTAPPPGVPVDVLVYTPRKQESWSARFRHEVEQGLRLYERV